MASGPSLCADDVHIVRDWHRNGDGKVIVVNTTFRMAPWADILYASDGGWWREYGAEAVEKHHGEKLCYAQMGTKYGAKQVNVKTGKGGLHPDKDWINAGGNSGHQAIHVARNRGAKRIMLLGFDMAMTHGKAHWHGNHPRGLGNAGHLKAWIPFMDQMYADLTAEGITALNCSRHTAIKSWPRMSIECALS